MKQRKTWLILACLGAFLLLCGMSAVPRCIPAEIEYNLLNPVPAAVAVADGFTGIETLTEEQYEYAQGVVTLKDTALQVLGEGEHTLTFLFGAETETVTVRIISLMPTLAAMPQAPVFDLYQPEDVSITLAMEHCVLTDVPQVQGYTYENGVLVLPAEALSDLPVGQHILTLVCGQVSFDLELTVKDTTPLGLEVNGTDIAQGSGEGWQYAEGCLQLESGAFTLSGSAAGVGILAADGAEVTLNGVQINGTVTGLGSLMIACEGENKIDGALKAPILTVSGGSLSVLSVEADDLLLDKTVVHADGTIKAQQTAQAVSAVLLAEEAPAFGSDTAVFLRQSADFYLLRSNAKLAASLTVPGEKLVLAVPYRVSLRTETGNTLTVAGTVLRAGTVSGVTGNVERATLVSRVRLNKSSAVISINKGEALGKQLLLTATINAGADIRKLTWESSDEAVATVDQNGMVTSVGTGRAYIYARATDGTRRYARCRVTVQKTPVSRISMDASQYLYLELGDTFGKTAIIPYKLTPDTAYNQTIDWSSSRPQVATVDQNGVATSVGTGDTYIYARATDGSRRYDRLKLRVRTVKVSQIKMQTKATIDHAADEPMGKQITLTADVYPGNAYNPAIAWSTSNKNIATVDQNGVVKATGRGTCYIYAKATDGSGRSARCRVTVNNIAVTSVSLPSSATLGIMPDETLGKTLTLVPTVKPAEAHDQRVRWSTSNKRVATVDENGVVTSVGYGKATITCTAMDGSRRSSRCTVRVTKIVPVTDVELQDCEIKLGQEKALSPRIAPSNATNKKLTYTSSDPETAKVDANGRVTGVSLGTATITAKTTDNSDITASCQVTVKVDLAGLAYKGESKLPRSVTDKMEEHVAALDKSLTTTKAIMSGIKYLGQPYRKMDCSLFVRTAYADIGISLPRQSFSQGVYLENQGRAIEWEQIKPGDLIFFMQRDCGCNPCERYLNIHHVAMYFGCVDGTHYFMESSYGRQRVLIRPIWGNKPGGEYEIVLIMDMNKE